MISDIRVRPLHPNDQPTWRQLWDDYNAFYGRSGETALPETVTRTTWSRFFDLDETLFALVAERDGAVVGLAHYLFHRSTIRVDLVCYLQDLYTAPGHRGTGVGRALIEDVYARALHSGASRVYWQTQADNLTGRQLYERVAQHHGFIVYSKELRASA